jgi:hypothetical protein
MGIPDKKKTTDIKDLVRLSTLPKSIVYSDSCIQQLHVDSDIEVDQEHILTCPLMICCEILIMRRWLLINMINELMARGDITHYGKYKEIM